MQKLQTFNYVAVTKEFTDDRFSVNLPSFSNKGACLGKKTIPWWMHKFMVNTMSQESIPYIVVSVSYDGLCKRLWILFSIASVHIKLFARPAV